MTTFEKLSKINVNDHKEDRNGLSYLSWSWAWDKMKRTCPDATYTIWRDEQGRPYLYDPNLGYMVFVSVTADGETHDMWLPVMDNNNKAMLDHPYTYQTRYKEVTVAAATMFDINKTLMRCLVKCIGMFGLGLYIYSGEDLPAEEKVPKAEIITAKDAEMILQFCRENQINSDELCKLYKVDAVTDLNAKQYRNIMEHLTEIKAKFGGKA